MKFNDVPMIATSSSLPPPPPTVPLRSVALEGDEEAHRYGGGNEGGPHGWTCKRPTTKGDGGDLPLPWMHVGGLSPMEGDGGDPLLLGMEEVCWQRERTPDVRRQGRAHGQLPWREA